jgi:plasmid stabilization system protein ParE
VARVNWTLQAERWLQKIHDYIAERNPEAATKVVLDLIRQADTLALFPEMGYKYRSEPEGDIRVLVYGRYKIAYLLRSQDEVVVLGIFHGAMEMDQYLDQ